MTTPDRNQIAAAALSRNRQLRAETPSRVFYMPHDEEHVERQKFRKLIVRDIVDANTLKQAIRSLELVLTYARNILKDPENQDLRKFRITNLRVKADIMTIRGVRHLVEELGFRIKAEGYDGGCYVFSEKQFHALRLGASMIEEILTCKKKKHEEDEQRKQRDKKEQEDLVKKLSAQILDDRRSVAARVQRERQAGVYEKGIPPRKGAPTKDNIVTIHG